MSWTYYLEITFWIGGMAYTALAVFIPELRLGWERTSILLGPLSSLAFAWFFWGVPILWGVSWLTGIHLATLEYFIWAAIFVTLGGAGYLMDVTQKHKF